MSRFITQDLKVIKSAESYRAAESVHRLSKETMSDEKKVLIAFMNEHNVETMEAGNNLVRVTRYSTIRFDSTKFKKDFPDIAAEYSVEVPAIRFEVRDA